MNNLFTLLLLLRKGIYLALGRFDILMGRKNKSIFILSYHSISNDSWRFGVELEALKEQVLYLKKHYVFLSLSDVSDFISGKREFDKPGVVITFDDGYEDILQTKEFFKKQRIKPTLFLLADTKHANYVELATGRPFLQKLDILSLVKEGWEIGSHSNTHANLASLSGEVLRREVISSKGHLERWLSLRVRFFAYPRGKYSAAVLACVREAKYDLGLTMDDGYIRVGSDVFTLPRVGVDRTHTFGEFQSSFSPSVVWFRRMVKKSFLGRYL